MCPLGKVQKFDYFHCCVCAGVHEADLLESRSPTLDLAKTSRWTTQKTSAGSRPQETRAVGERDLGYDEGKPCSKHWSVLQTMRGGKKDRADEIPFLIGQEDYLGGGAVYKQYFRIWYLIL